MSISVVCFIKNPRIGLDNPWLEFPLNNLPPPGRQLVLTQRHPVETSADSWPHLRHDVRAYIQSCVTYQKMSRRNQEIRAARFVVSTLRPMQRIAMDTIGPLPEVMTSVTARRWRGWDVGAVWSPQGRGSFSPFLRSKWFKHTIPQTAPCIHTHKPFPAT